MAFSASYLLDQLTTGPEVDGGRYLVGYSGGMDSHLLLCAMAGIRNRLKADIAAIHIHHGVSIRAEDWVSHCQLTCDRLNIPLEVVAVQADTSQPSLENELRAARYRAFEERLAHNDLLLLAHHADDQVETIIQRLLRGSGPRGISGMPRSRVIGKARLLRPLLDLTRSELRQYATTAGLEWVEDESNRDERFDRNYIRHQLVPKLERRWPGFRKTFIRHADISAQTDQCLGFFLDRELAAIRQTSQEIDIKLLQQYPRSVQINLLRRWLELAGMGMPGYDQLNGILREVVGAKRDAAPQLRCANWIIRRYQQKLWVGKLLPPHDPSRVIDWKVKEALTDPAMGCLKALPSRGEGISVQFAQTPLRVGFRQGGERCRPQGRQGSHPLKKLLQEYAVPPWLRDRVPLVYRGEDLVAVADLWVCHGFSAKSDSKGLRLVWDRP